MTESAPLIGAVLGSPISHSLSPAIYRAAFREMGIVGEYTAIDCTSAQLEQTFRSLQEKNVRALSITMPLKETILPLLSSIDSDAQLLNAVNCVSFSGDRSVGHNTDGDGCCDALEQQGNAALAGAHAVVLGAGGTARSVALALGRRRAHVSIVNRTFSNADRLVATLSRDIAAHGGTITVGSVDSVHGATVVVNTTSVGMNSDVTPLPAHYFQAGQVVLDAVYQPMLTSFLRDGRAAGAITIDGLWMLIQQARRQCLHQFGITPPSESLREAAERELSLRHK